MGNCCMRHGHDSNTVWAGDDWGSPMSKRFTTRGSSRYDDGYYSDEKPKKTMRKKKTDYYEAEEKMETCVEQRSALLVVDDNDDDDHKKNVMSTEVKVRITKRQLEELLGNVEVKGLSVQELLEQLMNVNTSTTSITTTTTHGSTIRYHRSWRPALNSIPEMIEAIN